MFNKYWKYCLFCFIFVYLTMISLTTSKLSAFGAIEKLIIYKKSLNIIACFLGKKVY